MGLSASQSPSMPRCPDSLANASLGAPRRTLPMMFERGKQWAVAGQRSARWLDPKAAPPPAEARPNSPGPRLKLGLRSVLIVVSLSVLLVPLLGVYILRLHETTLLQQTQGELEMATTLLVSSYRVAFSEHVGAGFALSSPESRASPPPMLNFPSAGVAQPFPDALPGPLPDPVAERVGERLASVLEDAQLATAASLRLLDEQGVVVATTEVDQGMSLAHVEEVRSALDGIATGRLRRVSEHGQGLQLLVRGTATIVHLATPVTVQGRVVGVVTASRQPSTIIDTLMQKRYLLLQGAGLFLAVAIGVAVITARTLVLPLQQLRRGARRVSRGETEHFERGRQYRVHEFADLADSIETMVLNLQNRTNYLRDFVRQVNHEFKTPIAAARGAVDILSDYLDDMTSEDARRFVDNLSKDLIRLDRLTQRLLQLAQADLSEANEEVTDVLEVARQLASPAVRVVGERANARVPAASIRAVLELLVENAVEHGASKVHVRAERRGEELELRVEDDGPGIAPSDRPHVFNPFYTTRSENGGTGLGLAICHALVRTAGGAIALSHSERGTAFTMTLAAAP